MEQPGFWEGLFRSFGWLVKQVQQGEQRWDCALALALVPAIIRCALGWRQGGIIGTLLCAAMGALAGVGIFWWFARNTSPGPGSSKGTGPPLSNSAFARPHAASRS
jgi:hypothetical protein